MAGRKVWQVAVEDRPPSLLPGAACADTDPDLWFRRDEEGETRWSVRATHAKRVCDRCPILERCRSWSLATRQEHGVWGGLDEEERAYLLRRTRATRAAS